MFNWKSRNYYFLLVRCNISGVSLWLKNIPLGSLSERGPFSLMKGTEDSMLTRFVSSTQALLLFPHISRPAVLPQQKRGLSLVAVTAELSLPIEYRGVKWFVSLLSRSKNTSWSMQHKV